MSKIFDNVVDVENYLGTHVTIPSDIPEDCNVLCYSEATGNTPSFYKDCHNSLHYIDGFSGVSWESPRKTLEQEAVWDNCYGYNLAYLRLEQKDKFTPERLLGVETTEGFVTHTFPSFSTGRLFLHTTGCRNLLVSEVEYYISDDSDEAVSFDEYLKLFYEVEGVL